MVSQEGHIAQATLERHQEHRFYVGILKASSDVNVPGCNVCTHTYIMIRRTDVAHACCAKIIQSDYESIG